MRGRAAPGYDGCLLQFACSDRAEGKPWIALIIPFGLQAEVALAFFDCFAADYNIVTWEARLILAPPERHIASGELTVANHVADLFAVLDACGVERATLVGYCSGAGVALAALKAAPQRFDDLVLVSGDYMLLKEPACVTPFGNDIDSILSMASRDLNTAQLILERMRTILDGMASGQRSPHRPAPPEGIKLPFSQAHYFHRYALNYLGYRAMDFVKLAWSVRRRTLLLAGDCDQQTNVTSSRRIHRCIPGSQLWVVPEGDHYDLLRPGSSTLDQVRSFLLASEVRHRA